MKTIQEFAKYTRNGTMVYEVRTNYPEVNAEYWKIVRVYKQDGKFLIENENGRITKNQKIAAGLIEDIKKGLAD
jgi:hypothetical protein